jgi:hypothetical protein
MSRLHYHLATIGYWASRMKARSPRPDSLLGDSLSFGAAVRYELPSHTTSRQNRHPDLSRRDDSCNCFSLMVTSDRSHKGLSPSITAPCPAHLRPRLRLSIRNTVELLNPDSLTRTGSKSGGWSNQLDALACCVPWFKCDSVDTLKPRLFELRFPGYEFHWR